MLAKGYCSIKYICDKELKEFLTQREKFISAIDLSLNNIKSRSSLEESALQVHTCRMISEFFGKADGYCRSVGGGMHIADFSINHLGVNVIVGGHMGIATGAAISCRYQKNNKIILCLTNDRAYSNGISHESINLATMAQFNNGLMSESFGVPVIFAIVNNQYAMSGQEEVEITGVDYLARRRTAYNLNNMNAEIVDGMDVLAVNDAGRRASSLSRNGKGPVLLEFITYRFKGHSLSDSLSYRSHKELTNWHKRDPINIFIENLTKTYFPENQGGNISIEEINILKDKVYERNASMAIKAAYSPDPVPEYLTKHVYSDDIYNEIFKKNKPKKSSRKCINSTPIHKINEKGEITYRIAIREALIEEMMREENVILFGEDVADYGGAFGVTVGLLSLFGRNRIFNTSISESGIVGAAIGMNMTGLYPMIEIMYNNFILQTMDQIGNQAAKWSYMSGGQVGVPIVIRGQTIGGGEGYAGQHSQSLEAIVTHMPGLIVATPSNPYDAKGLLKSSIINSNPVIFFEHQLLYNMLGVVPEEEHYIPLGKARITIEGSDITLISWSYVLNECLKASSLLSEQGRSVEVIDARTLIPLDTETIVESIKKTGKAVVCSQEVTCSSFVAEILSQIMEQAFDYLVSHRHQKSWRSYFYQMQKE